MAGDQGLGCCYRVGDVAKAAAQVTPSFESGEGVLRYRYRRGRRVKDWYMRVKWRGACPLNVAGLEPGLGCMEYEPELRIEVDEPLTLLEIQIWGDNWTYQPSSRLPYRLVRGDTLTLEPHIHWPLE
jgi:hypothetical protein